MVESPIGPMFRKKLETFKPDCLIKVFIYPLKHFKLEESLAQSVEKDSRFKFSLDNYKKIREIEKAHMNSLRAYLDKAKISYFASDEMLLVRAEMKKDDIYELEKQPFVSSISDY